MKSTATMPAISARQLAASLLILSLVFVVAAAIACLVATQVASHASLPPILLGAAVCWVSAVFAHVSGRYPSGNEFIMVRLMASMMIRTAPPLVAAILAKIYFPSLLERGFVFFIILFYLVGLFSDVVLHALRLKNE